MQAEVTTLAVKSRLRGMPASACVPHQTPTSTCSVTVILTTPCLEQFHFQEGFSKPFIPLRLLSIACPEAVFGDQTAFLYTLNSPTAVQPSPSRLSPRFGVLGQGMLLVFPSDKVGRAGNLPGCRAHPLGSSQCPL